MTIGFKCPTCNKYVAESLAPGQQSRCPFCGQAIVMEQPQAPAESSPQQFIFCAKCGMKNEENNYKCTSCGFVLHGQKQYVVSDDSTLGGLIPHRNPHALWAYYLGIFSLVPCFGALLCIPALILGIKGVRKTLREPQAKGKVHAMVGIVLGGLCLLGYLLLAFFTVLGTMSNY